MLVKVTYLVYDMDSWGRWKWNWWGSWNYHRYRCMVLLVVVVVVMVVVLLLSQMLQLPFIIWKISPAWGIVMPLSCSYIHSKFYMVLLLSITKIFNIYQVKQLFF